MQKKLIYYDAIFFAMLCSRKKINYGRITENICCAARNESERLLPKDARDL